MKLLSAKVENYKSIEDSSEYNIKQITCFVGKNESGKTANLQALYKLNPIYGEIFDITSDYPRSKLSSYKRKIEKGGEDHDNILKTKWLLEEKDKKVISDYFGLDILTSNEVEITKGYDNKRYYSVHFDEKKLINHFIKNSSLVDSEKTSISGLLSVHAIIDYLTKLEAPTETQSAFLNFLTSLIPKGMVSQKVINLIDRSLPKFVYFSNYSKLQGTVSLNSMKQLIQADNLSENDRVFIALLESVNTTIEEIESLPKFEDLIAELEGISNEVSTKIFSYWSQNPYLEVNFSLDMGRPEDPAPFNSGYVFRTRIRNNRHKVTVPFDERSTGFVWFFSFLIWFSQVKNNYGENLIILLDEPGLSLHAKAQEDLLKYINDELKPKFQVLYTTHSPFMVWADLDCVKTVEDVIEKDSLLGTKVSSDVLSTDSDTLFPLQAALGYSITQSLFIGKNTLLVEGPSDLLYLKIFSRELEKLGREGLDKRWVITPCGGLDKVGAFIALFSGNKLNIAVLTDFHRGDKNKVRSLKESKLLKDGSVFSAELYSNTEEADIEDIIGKTTYFDLVNKTYSLSHKHLLNVKDTSKRAIEEVEEQFRTFPSSVAGFDHYRPAEYLIENSGNISVELKDIEKTLDSFERLFKDINLLIKK